MGYQYPRQAILAPIGLVTEPNEYNQYPAGALKTAKNMVLRAPGKLEQAPGFADQVQVGATFDTIMKLVPADTGVVYAFVATGFGTATITWVIYGDGSVETFVGSATDAFSATGRIGWAQCVERVVVNGKFGCLVRDPVPLSTQWRAAGLPQIGVNGGVTTTIGWLAPNQMVGYRVCLVRRYPQDYTLRSVPSLAIKVFTGALPTARNVNIFLVWPTAAGIEAGDVIEVYRTDILATTSDTADPGATYKLVQEYTLTAADIAGPGTKTLVDTQAPVTGTLKTPGRELYTNPGVEGETYANLRPPICECLASFKGFCFYGNTTERAQLEFTVPAGLGALTTPATIQLGVGFRTGVGTVTTGSPNVTAVPAADIVGVKVGQLWSTSAAGFVSTATVITVGATSFTMSVNATSNQPAWQLEDVIEINGVKYRAGNLTSLLFSLGGLFEAQAGDTLPTSGGALVSVVKVTLMWNYHSFKRSISVRATNGANYSPPLPEITATAKSIDPIVRKNRLTWSKEQQPEHAPSVSETLIGFGEMYALNATRDALWIWCSDGLFRLSGNAGSLGLGAWQTDYANSTLLLCAPQASTALAEKLYGYTNEGVVELDSAGNVSHKTAGIIGDLVVGPRYRETAEIILERNESDGELLLAAGHFDGPWSHEVYVYNVRSRGWTRLEQLGEISALAMFRLPPDPGGGNPPPDPHALFGVVGTFFAAPTYSGWKVAIGVDYLEGTAQYQPIYGDDPLELKRWMWADYLFDQGSLLGSAADHVITVLWNSISFGPVPFRALDAGVYARAGCPRAVGLSHSISPGFSWAAAASPRAFEGISLAVKQRTNQSKAR